MGSGIEHFRILVLAQSLYAITDQPIEDLYC